MRKTIYIIISILVITIISATSVLAQKVYDVYSNEYMPITNSLYKEVKARNSIFNNEVEVLYFRINNENTKAIKSINKQAYSICLDYLIDEKKSMKLMSELEQRLSVKMSCKILKMMIMIVEQTIISRQIRLCIL